jgi:hypothetical protein
VVPSIYMLIARVHAPALAEEIEIAPLRGARPERRRPSRAWTSAGARAARAQVEAAAARM